MSQEQLAEKLCVSRQAITKWESDKGMPNIESLQCISKLFDVSIDHLLDDEKPLSTNTIKENININDYKKTKEFHSIYDVVVKSKFPQAKKITPLIRSKKLSFIENIIDFIQPGLIGLADALNDTSTYYLIDLDNCQLLSHVTKDFIESYELGTSFQGKKKIIGSNVFKKLPYTV